jgi:flagellar hook protein FlgE
MPSFFTPLSGLNASSAAIDVVGNNLANMNTTGFKASSTSFRDLVGDAMAAPGAINGQGVGPATSERRFSQGAIQATSGSLDAAISGDGFFLLRNQQGQQLLTRAGDFRVDANGNLLSSTGINVQGWNATNGVVNASGAVSNITLPAIGVGAPLATSSLSITANLNSGAPATAASSFSTPVPIVDSLGATHMLTVTFTKTGPNAWSFDVTIPGEDIGATAGTASNVATGTLAFNAQGQLTTPAAPSTVPLAVSGLVNGAAPLAMNWGLRDAAGQSQITQFEQTSATAAVNQDGAAAAELVKVSIADGGVIMAQYSNGRERAVAQLATANLRNPSSLAAAGGNNYRLSAQSSALAVGTAGSGGRGRVVAGSLESSTVDIAKEFTNLIVYQRGYQANSKVISTLDELSQEVINLKR